VARAILAGETETGVTLFRVEAGLDSGPVVAAARVAILSDETAGGLEARLAAEAARLLERELDRFADGSFRETPQDHARATSAPKLTKEEGLIDWTEPAARVHDRVRAMQPWPLAYSFLAGGSGRSLRLIFRRTRVAARGGGAAAAPGAVVRADRDALVVACGEGELEVLEVQPEGRSSMAVRAFLNGRPVLPGERFSAEPAKR
jgi:methionyl-tRNA formyltransferase